MILVAGGTGTLGRQLLGRLLDAGESIRVLTRDASRIPDARAEAAIGDLRDPDSLTAAVSGCDAVVSAAHGFLGGRGAGPQEIDRDGNRNLIQAATAAGAKTFVLVSMQGSTAHSPWPLKRAKYAAEQAVKASPMAWTIVRPTVYAQTWLAIVGAKLADGGPATVFGRATNPINFVAVQDVASTIIGALSDPAAAGLTVDVAGPENFTLTDLANMLGATKIKHVPRGALAVLRLAAIPVSPAFARQAAAALAMDTLDMTARPSANPLAGTEPTTLAEVIARVAQ